MTTAPAEVPPGVIPTSEELAEISRLREGDLGEIPFGVLLHALAVHERTVVVEISRKQLFKRIIVEYGVPVDCRSNLVNETLGRFMVAQGKLTDDQASEYFAEAHSRGVRLGEILVEEGLITPFELYKVLQQNLAKKLLDGFTWIDGGFRMLFDVPEVESPLKVKVPQLVLTGVTKFALKEEVNRAVAPLIGKRLALHPDRSATLAGIKLTHRQQRFVDALARPQRIDELAQTADLAHDDVSRIVYALAILGAVVPEDQLPATPKVIEKTIPVEKEAPEEKVSAAEAATRGGEQIDLEERRNEIMQTYLSYRRQDAFDLLGVPEDASIAAIQEKYVDFARKYAPWLYEGGDLMPVAARDLFLAAARAYAELSHTERRNTLLYRRKRAREESARERQVGPSRIKTDLLDPEPHYKKGRALMDAGNYEEAIQLLEFASDCDPQNGVYRSELAFCRFLDSPTPGGEEALKSLKEAMRIDPQCGLAVYYAGEVQRELGNYQEAEKYLRKSIRMMAPDRRPIEALKALGTQRKRKR